MSEHETSYEFDLILDYDYSPGEDPVYDPDSPMAGPGCPEEVVINSCTIKGTDIQLQLPGDIEKIMENEILDELRAGEL